MDKTEKRNCKFCNKEFQARLGEIRAGRANFCCQNHFFMSKRYNKICEYCGQNFFVCRSELEKHETKFCSFGCYVNSKKGIQLSLTRRIMRTKEYAKWRTAVYERDGFECQECGMDGAVLNAHHILRVSEYPHLALDIDNGITLCKKCHCKKHEHLMKSHRKYFINKTAEAGGKGY